MTDQERIEALIESLNTICDRMKGAGLGRYVGRIREAAAQLRADRPAEGEAIPADDKDRERIRYREALKQCYDSASDSAKVRQIVADAIAPTAPITPEDMEWAHGGVRGE